MDAKLGLRIPISHILFVNLEFLGCLALLYQKGSTLTAVTIAHCNNLYDLIENTELSSSAIIVTN